MNKTHCYCFGGYWSCDFNSGSLKMWDKPISSTSYSKDVFRFVKGDSDLAVRGICNHWRGR